MNNKDIIQSLSNFPIRILGIILILSIMVGCKGAKKTHSASHKKERSEKRTSNKDENREVEKLIKTARSYTGTRYRFGGSTRAGMDCSGLVSTTFKSLDILLPRTSAEQSKMGKQIATNQIREGDLVFFTDRKGHKKVTHVGLVTDVSKDRIKFIHSSTQLGVVENDLFSDYYKSIFLKATRILP